MNNQYDVTITVSQVNMSKAVIFLSGTSGHGSYLAQILAKVELISNNAVKITRSYADSVISVSFQLVEYY